MSESDFEGCWDTLSNRDPARHKNSTSFAPVHYIPWQYARLDRNARIYVGYYQDRMEWMRKVCTCYSLCSGCQAAAVKVERVVGFECRVPGGTLRRDDRSNRDHLAEAVDAALGCKEMMAQVRVSVGADVANHPEAQHCHSRDSVGTPWGQLPSPDTEFRLELGSRCLVEEACRLPTNRFLGERRVLAAAVEMVEHAKSSRQRSGYRVSMPSLS